MTGREFKALRRRLGLTLVEFGRALGYQGNDRNVNRLMRQYDDMDDEDLPPGPAIRAQKLAEEDSR